MTDASGRVTTYGYDPANRRTSVGYTDTATPKVSFSYTPAGRRATMLDGTGTSTYTYDSLVRLTDQTNGGGQHSGYVYDLAGHLTKLTYPNAKIVTRGYDPAGRLTSITDWAGHTTTLTPDADGNTASTTYGNAVVASSTFDAVDQMSATTVAGPTGATLASLTYTVTGKARWRPPPRPGCRAAPRPTGTTRATSWPASMRGRTPTTRPGTPLLWRAAPLRPRCRGPAHRRDHGRGHDRLHL